MLNWSIYTNYIELGLFIAFCFFAAIQLFYYLRFYLPVLFFKDIEPSETGAISVIICARNEARNLEQNLKYILEQNYPNFEVIVVNDCSTDSTDDVLGDYLKKYNNLRTTSIPLDRKFSHGKKLALTIGVKSAKHNQLVFTDADCRPDSTNWLKLMSQGFTNKEIVLSYGGFVREKTLLNNYIRYDALSIALTYLGFALAKTPYMGVGRNLAYKKDLFFKNKGFASNYGILSGDDDLFINEVANRTNTTIVINKDAFTRSTSQKTWSNFFNQKIRHLSSAGCYKSTHLFMLGIEPVSRAWFYVLLILLLSLKIHWIPVVSIAGLRTITQLFIYSKAGKRFGEKNIWMTYIIFDLYSLFFNFVTYCTLSIRRKYIRWK